MDFDKTIEDTYFKLLESFKQSSIYYIKKAGFYYVCNSSSQIIIIIASAASSALLAANSENRNIQHIALGFTSLTTILSSVQSLLKWTKRQRIFSKTSLEFENLANMVSIEIATPQEFRLPPHEFTSNILRYKMNVRRTHFDSLNDNEQSKQSISLAPNENPQQSVRYHQQSSVKPPTHPQPKSEPFSSITPPKPPSSDIYFSRPPRQHTTEPITRPEFREERMYDREEPSEATHAVYTDDESTTDSYPEMDEKHSSESEIVGGDLVLYDKAQPEEEVDVEEDYYNPEPHQYEQRSAERITGIAMDDTHYDNRTKRKDDSDVQLHIMSTCSSQIIDNEKYLPENKHKRNGDCLIC